MANVDSRSKIMKTAIEMFNEKGVSNTSPAQIAARLGMRPSNLYYYFENKEHLIRAIWQEMMVPAVTPIFFENEARLSECGIINLFTLCFNYVSEYRFFYLQLYTILSVDPILRDYYIAHHRELVDRILVCMDSWVKLGIMQDVSVAERRVLAENIWVAALNHITFLKLTVPNALASEFALDTAHYAYTVLRPNLTEGAVDRIELLLDIESGNGQSVMAPTFGAAPAPQFYMGS